MNHLPHIRDRAPEQFAGLWLHDDVERRLREACATLHMMPMPIGGMPTGNRANWPEVVLNAADHAGEGDGDGTVGKNTRKERDADRNRVRLAASGDQIREMDECLGWLMLIRDGRHRKVVFARSHVWPDSARPMVKYTRLAREFGAHAYTLKRWYRRGIRDICDGLNGLAKS